MCQARHFPDGDTPVEQGDLDLAHQKGKESSKTSSKKLIPVPVQGG